MYRFFKAMSGRSASPDPFASGFRHKWTRWAGLLGLLIVAGLTLLPPLRTAQGQAPGFSGGPVNTPLTLTAADGPYTITQSITVQNGGALTIQAGATLRMSPGTYIEANGGGQILANGVSGQPVTFTAATSSQAAGDWRGFFFDGGSKGRFDFADIGYAGAGNEHAVRIDAADVSFSNSHIHDSARLGIYYNNPDAVSTLTNVTIEKTANFPIFLNNVNTQPTYSGLTFNNDSPNGIGTNGGGTGGTQLHWVNTGYPYYVQGTVVAQNGGKLTVDPGLTIRMAPGSYLQANGGGQIVANGTAALPITFTSDLLNHTAGDWRGFFFDGGSVGQISFADIGFAGAGNEHAVRIDAANVSLSNTHIHDSTNFGIYYLTSSAVSTLTNVSIENCANYPIFLNDLNTQPTYSNITLNNNGAKTIANTGAASNGIGTNGGGTGGTQLHWVNTGYPYYVLGTVVAQNGGKLTVDPGLTIRMTPGSYLQANGGGQIVANGTAALPITFTSDLLNHTAGDWRGFFFDGSSVGQISFADIGYAGAGNEHAVRIDNANVSLGNTHIHDSLNLGVYYLDPGAVSTLSGVTIENCANYPIFLNNLNTQPTFNGITLINNGTLYVQALGSASNGIGMNGGGTGGTQLHWVNIGHPIYVLDSVTVQNTGKLTVDPGLDVRIAPGKYIEANGGGQFIAEGVPGQIIRFAPNVASPIAGNWRGFFFDGGSKGRFDYADIGYAGAGNEHAVRIDAADVSLSNTHIHDSALYGLFYLNSGAVSTLTNVTIENTLSYSIKLNDLNTQPVFHGITLKNGSPNGIGTGGGGTGGTQLHWVNFGYPYYVLDSVTVQNGGKLTVDPGLEVRMVAGHYFEVNGGGELDAEGTKDQPIRFVPDLASPIAGNWRGFFFDGGSVGRITFSDIDYAGAGNEESVRIDSADVILRNSNIHHSANVGVLVNDGSNVVITGNRIENVSTGVQNNNPNVLVNAILNWWGDPNGPKNPANPLNTNGVPVSNGVLFQPWIGNPAGAGTDAPSELQAAFVPWPLFTSDATSVDANGQVFAVWKEILPQPNQGDPQFLTLPYAFGGVDFALTWKAGDKALLSGDAAGTGQFCVDGDWKLELSGPTPKTVSGSGCSNPVDFSTLGLTPGEYGGRVTLTAPKGAAHFGTSNVYLLSAGNNFRESNLVSSHRSLGFAAEAVSIPVGQIGKVPVHLATTPKPFTGMITHYDHDRSALTIDSFSPPAGWSGGGGGITFSENGPKPLHLNDVAFTMNIHCLRPGNWPISFTGNGFGLGPSNDPNQNLAYLTAVADTFSVSCTEADPVAGAIPIGASVNPRDGTTYVSVNGSGFNGINGATKAVLTNAANAIVAQTTDVTSSANGGNLTAHFATAPAGVYKMSVLGQNGSALATTDSAINVPPAIPLMDVSRVDGLPQLPGKAVSHIWRVTNRGNVDGVAIMEFGFESYIDQEPLLVLAGLPTDSIYLTHGALPNAGGWLEHVAIPVKAGETANVAWKVTVPPAAVFNNPPYVPPGSMVRIETHVAGVPIKAQWDALLQQLQTQGGGTVDALQAGTQGSALGQNEIYTGLLPLVALPDDQYAAYLNDIGRTYPDLGNRLNNLVLTVSSGLLNPDAAPVALARKKNGGGGPIPLDTPPVSNTGLPALPDGSFGAAQDVLFLMMQIYDDTYCPPKGGTGKAIAKDTAIAALGAIATRMNPATAAFWYVNQGATLAGKSFESGVVADGYAAYKQYRSEFLQTDYAGSHGLTADKPFGKADMAAFTDYINTTFHNNANVLDRATSYLATGDAIAKFQFLTPDQQAKGLMGLEFAYFQEKYTAELDKNLTAGQKFKNWLSSLTHKSSPIPGQLNPCPPADPVITTSYDPNEINVDPAGAQPGGWITLVPGPTLRYVIHFENLATATAAAEDIRVTLPLDPGLDISTVTVADSSFAGTQFAVDPATRTLTWFLPGVNLPPNTDSPSGEGFVSFTVMPNASLRTGSVIREKGSVFFDFNPAIITPEAITTIDVTPPMSTVEALADTQASANFQVKWDGTDEGSGVQDYTIFVKTDDSPYSPWLVHTPDTSAVFTGVAGKTYSFFSIARDRAGNEEIGPGGAQAVTKAGGSTTTPTRGDANLDGSVDVNDAILVLRYVVGLDTLTPQQIQGADADHSGSVDVTDAVDILKIIVGIPID